MQSFRGYDFVWLVGLVLSLNTYAKMDNLRRLPPSPLPTVAPTIPVTPTPAPRPSPTPKATQATSNDSDSCGDPSLSYEEKARRGCCENSAARRESQDLNNLCSYSCEDPSLSYEEQARRGCCENSAARRESQGLNNLCEGLNSSADNKLNRSIQDIWKNELERRRKMACGEDKKAEEESCPCMDTVLSPDIAARCANNMAKASNSDDFTNQVAGTINAIKHPLTFIPGLEDLGGKVEWSYGKGPFNDVVYHENEPSKVWVTIKLY